MKSDYSMTVIDDVFCAKHACDKQTRGACQSSRLTGVRLWVVTTLYTLRWEIGDKSRSWN